MGHPPNTADQESAQMMSADGHYLFFTRCENRSENGWGQGGCDLYMSYRSDSVWSVPESFGATINTPDFEGMPWLSADNRELYFCSNRPGGYGGFDLYVTRFEEGLWQAPRNLGPEINTAGNEGSPYLHIDGQTLYFSSDGLQGMGGKDLFMCRRINDTTWSKPVNMGYPINSTDDENSIYVSLDAKKMYFSSDRDSVAGNYDLYETHLPPALQPNPVSYFKGYVLDSLSKEKLTYATIVVSDAKSKKALYRFVSNRGDASYMITLPLGHKYRLDIERMGYQPWSDTITLTKQNFQHPIEKNISMLPLDYIPPINDTLLFSIHFPLNSIKLSDSDKVQINRMLEPWIMEKGIVFYVNGYTDNTGTPIRNEELSTKRANLIAREIKNKGFDEINIRSKGYGEAKPLRGNDTEEDRFMNRRVEVVIRR
jgi:outer membrane protein OmpA-like peptidoglycan-associated protein